MINTENLSKEFANEISWVNLNRVFGLAFLLCFASFGFLYTDYLNAIRGFWTTNPSYKLLFYSHVALGVWVFITLMAYFFTKPSNLTKLKVIHQVIIYLFIGYLMFVTAYISGWVDQAIHGGITVYTLGCFTIAITYYLKPVRGFLIYLLGYLVFILGVSITQANQDILQGYYINGSLLAVVSYGLTLVFYKMKSRDILYHNHMEELVAERTATLRQINEKLKMEIEERVRAVDNFRQTYDKLLRLASIVESSDDGIIGLSLDGIVNGWNPGAARIFGFSEKQILGEPILRIVPQKHHNKAKVILKKILNGNPVIHYQIAGQSNNGALLDISITASPIRNSVGTIVGISLIVRDITVQNKLQKEMSRLQQLNLVGEMAASISHEVRNPMTTVKGFLQLLNQKQDFKEYQDYFHLMIEELDRANNIISEFLSISRTKATEFKKYRLNQIIEKILPLLQADAILLDIHLSTQLSPTPEILLNEQEIRQVILNLARNGFEAMESGGRLTIETMATENEVVLIIRDQGPGIPVEVLEKLGTPFFSTKDNGTGLGLAVCYGIVERHNGKISVSTGPEGTTFSVRFRITG